ncbi:MAG: enoyl-CoA hydratase/isomerase family protein [Betaproteobacteria bacterium]|nr:enoyl-CoA hydratase/isomerase family protein [Betaproteobacteria bacterium]
MADTILLERAGDIATVVLNRPEKLNALTKPMWQRLGDVFLELSGDDAVRCIVLRGAGEKAFAPGNDISEFERERANVEQARAYGAVMTRTIEAIGGCRHPVVAQIHGVCVGGGLEIAGLADIRICGESSRFGVPINKLGLVMAYAEIGALIRLAGESVALEILLEGRVFGAAEALQKGLVTRVVPDAQVAAEAGATARRIADGAPLVARWHKQFAHRLRDAAALTAAELEEGYACYGTEDFRIGREAFLAKAKPGFKGR